MIIEYQVLSIFTLNNNIFQCEYKLMSGDEITFNTRRAVNQNIPFKVSEND